MKVDLVGSRNRGLAMGLNEFSGYLALWAVMNKRRIPLPDQVLSFGEKMRESRHLIPVVVLITSLPAATRAAPLPVLVPSAAEPTFLT